MVREIIPRPGAPEWRPPRPARRTIRRWQALAVIVGLLAVGIGAPPARTEASAWSDWTTHWYPARPAECAKARALLARKQATFIGPIPVYNHGCYYPVRSRRRAITAADYYYGDVASRSADGVVRSTTTFPSAAWMFETVQIGNTSPIWNVWGMTMTVDVAYNGVVATYNPDSKWCNDYSFVVKVTPFACDVLGAGSSNELIRMAYTASFIQSGLFFSVQHGAQKHVYGTGPADFTFWPVR